MSEILDYPAPVETPRAKKPGPPSDDERHRKILSVVICHDPDWRSDFGTWRQKKSLQRICADLDRQGIQLPHWWLTHGIREKHGSVLLALTLWSEVFDLCDLRDIKRVIQYSVDLARHDHVLLE